MPPQQAQQQAYVNQDFGAIIHWGMGTFVGSDGPAGNLAVDTFAPTGLDIDQWLDACVAAHMTYACLTVKHHNGLALWPSTVNIGATPYSIAQTAWYAANGSPDVVGLFVTKCRERNLNPVLYYSIQDLTWEARTGKDETNDAAGYIAMIKAQLTELLTNYGDITAIWFDGWKWHMGYEEIDPVDISDHIKSIQPNCLFIDNSHTHPALYSQIETYESNETPVAAGNIRFSEAVEVIRNDGHWFYFPADDHSAAAYKTKAAILSNLSTYNGRTCAYLLDLTPGTDGHLPAAQVALLESLGTP